MHPKLAAILLAAAAAPALAAESAPKPAPPPPTPKMSAAECEVLSSDEAAGHPAVVRRSQMIDIGALFLLVLVATGAAAPLLQGAPAAPFAVLAYNLMLCVDIAVLLLSLRGLRR